MEMGNMSKRQQPDQRECFVLKINWFDWQAGTEDGCVVVFSTQDDSLMYHQAFDKQEGMYLVHRKIH